MRIVLPLLIATAGFQGCQKAFVPEPLTECLVTNVREAKPYFVKKMREGDIAFYGILLQAYRKPEVAEYLIKNRLDTLWEYQKGYGVTAEDAAFVLEGLLEYGVDKKYLQESLDTLVREYYGEPGYFITIREGRAPYYSEASLETTAHIGYLMARIEPEKYKKQIRMAARFVAGQQQPDGSWRPLWFPSPEMTAHLSIRFLATQGEQYRQELNTGVDFLQRQQLPNGSWNDSAIDSAAALLALRAAGLSGLPVEKARQYLRIQSRSTKQRVEPVLHYWFEDDGAREYFVCLDRGELAKAWIKIALGR